MQRHGHHAGHCSFCFLCSDAPVALVCTGVQQMYQCAVQLTQLLRAAHAGLPDASMKAVPVKWHMRVVYLRVEEYLAVVVHSYVVSRQCLVGFGQELYERLGLLVIVEIHGL